MSRGNVITWSCKAGKIPDCQSSDLEHIGTETCPVTYVSVFL